MKKLSSSAFFEQAFDAIFLSTTNDELLEVNQFMEQLSGFSSKELLSMNLKELLANQEQFDPFFTRKENGVGPGLMNARQIISAHGGKIHVESKEGEGSCFIITLPLKKFHPIITLQDKISRKYGRRCRQ